MRNRYETPQFVRAEALHQLRTSISVRVTIAFTIVCHIRYVSLGTKTVYAVDQTLLPDR